MPPRGIPLHSLAVARLGLWLPDIRRGCVSPRRLGFALYEKITAPLVAAAKPKRRKQQAGRQ
jgi:hypothetical protein